MLNLPILNSLSVQNYGLFPGHGQSSEGLHVDFGNGLTLVLGTNGLGKTTLVTILYRLLTGPSDIPGLADNSELGNLRLVPKLLPTSQRRALAERVADGARDANAVLRFRLGNHDVLVSRHLHDLKLLSFEVDNQSQELSETRYQSQIAGFAGVFSFGDWILALTHLMFYLERRRALVWDPSAQRQVLRFLFLNPSVSRKWSQLERAILEMDSSHRNLRNAVSRGERDITLSEDLMENAPVVHEELQGLEQLQQRDLEQRERLDAEFAMAEALRDESRLKRLALQQEHESRYREVERARLRAVESRFPSRSESARFIVAQLLTDTECLVCGNTVPVTAQALQNHISRNECVICGSDLSDLDIGVSSGAVAGRRIARATRLLQRIHIELEAATNQAAEAEDSYARISEEWGRIDVSIRDRSRRIDRLIRSLPPGEEELHKARSEFAALRSRVTALGEELTRQRLEFQTFVDEQNRAIVSKSEEIVSAFHHYAEGFLLDDCELQWSPHKASLGQGGAAFTFPAFSVLMAGGDFVTPQKRTGPEQVSESQREFIDLAFRMSLIEVAATEGIGSIVIDAPEASLDAVFSSKAADVLADFARPGLGNRLVVASNLVEGNLLPELLARSSSGDSPREHIVNLLDIATPTAAVREMKSEYQRALNQIVGRAARGNRP